MLGQLGSFSCFVFVRHIKPCCAACRIYLAHTFGCLALVECDSQRLCVSHCCRFDDGVALCESLLQLCPESCTFRDALADLHIKSGNGEQAVSIWLHALAECPNNAEVFYHCCTFLMAQVSIYQQHFHFILFCYNKK